MASPLYHGLSDRVPAWRGVQAIAAAIGGAAWTLVPLLYGVRVLEPLAAGPPLVALAPPLLLVGVWGFYERYAPSYSQWGRGGLAAIGLGLLGLWPFSLIEFLPVGVGAGFVVLYTAVAAGVVLELGAVGVAVDCWRTGVPSRWMAGWFPLALPLGALVNYWALDLWIGYHYYAGLSGLAWVAFGYRLWRPTSNEP